MNEEQERAIREYKERRKLEFVCGIEDESGQAICVRAHAEGHPLPGVFLNVIDFDGPEDSVQDASAELTPEKIDTLIAALQAAKAHAFPGAK